MYEGYAVYANKPRADYRTRSSGLQTIARYPSRGTRNLHYESRRATRTRSNIFDPTPGMSKIEMNNRNELKSILKLQIATGERKVAESEVANWP